jgi:hypothetical protein
VPLAAAAVVKAPPPPPGEVAGDVLPVWPPQLFENVFGRLLYRESYDLRTTTSAVVVVVVVDNILGKELASRPIAAADADAAGAAVDDKELVGETSPMDHDADVDDDAVYPTIASFVRIIAAES